MYAQVKKTPEKKSHMAANAVSQMQNSYPPTTRFVDNRPVAIQMRRLRELAKNSPQNDKLRELHHLAAAHSVAQKKSNGKQGFGFVDYRPEDIVQRILTEKANGSSRVKQRAKIIQRGPDSDGEEEEVQAVASPLNTLQQVGFTCYLYASLNSVNYKEEAKYLRKDVCSLIYQLKKLAEGQQEFNAGGSPSDIGYRKPISVDKAHGAYEAGASIVARIRGRMTAGYVDHALAVVPNADRSFLIIDSNAMTETLYSAEEVQQDYILYIRESSSADHFGPNTTMAINGLLSNIKAKNIKDQKKRAANLKASIIESVQILTDEIASGTVMIDEADRTYLQRILNLLPKK